MYIAMTDDVSRGARVMRKELGVLFAALVMSGSAMAADLAPAYKAPSPPMPLFSWTGFYIGVHAGAGWGLKEQPLTTGVPAVIINENNYSITGFLGGGQVGFNYQTGPVVWGA